MKHESIQPEAIDKTVADYTARARKLTAEQLRRRDAIREAAATLEALYVARRKIQDREAAKKAQP